MVSYGARNDRNMEIMLRDGGLCLDKCWENVEKYG